MLLISQLKVNIKADNSAEGLLAVLSDKTGIDKDNIFDVVIRKKSIDARKNPEIFYVYSLSFNTDKQYHKRLLSNKKLNISVYEPAIYKFPEINITGEIPEEKRPVIIGSGPAGYMCGYKLAQAGLRPIIIERGEDADERKKKIESFWTNDILDKNSNVQFGEGGAGTFSDGKLLTGVNDKFGRSEEVFRIYVENGAPEEILYNAKPHIGTDKLTEMVKNMRKFIETHGGEVRFNSVFKQVDINYTMLTEPVINSVVIKNLTTDEEYEIKTDTVVIATGHSSRDTYKMLHESGLAMTSKPFAVGFRVQHPQSLIDKARYGSEDTGLPPADYKLTFETPGGKSVYSFCMCPGGYVINSSSRPGYLVVNGMSYFARDSKNANSAIIAAVDEKTYGDGLFAGMHFQEMIEKRAFDLNGGKMTLQKLIDFKNNIPSMSNGAPGIDTEVTPEVKGLYTYGNLRTILPEELNLDIIQAFEDFGRKIEGFDGDNVLLCGVESRTSAPLRILRDNETLMSNISGIYPCGEGAGYAGGITSAAIDGLKVAEKIAKVFSNKQL